MRPSFRIWPRSIRYQLVAGVALIHLVLMTAFVTDLVQRQRRFLLDESLERTRTLATTLAVSSSSWVLANDVVGLQEVVRSLESDPELRYAMVLSKEGRVLAHVEESQQGRWVRDERSLAFLGSKAGLETVWSGADLVDVAAPIRTSTGVPIAWARVGMSRTHMRESLVAVARNGVLYTVAAFALGSVFALAVGHRLTEGLSGLVKVSSMVRDGRRDVRATTDRRDEVAQLGR